MARFIPRDHARVDALTTRLAGTLFQNVEMFVNLYNSGMINRSFDENKDLAAEVVEAYKDVRTTGGALTFISEAEILVDEAVKALSVWPFIARIRREVQEAVNTGELSESDSVTIDGEGRIIVLTVEGELRDDSPISGTKPRQGDWGVLADLAGSESRVRVSDILAVDDSFIRQVHDSIPNA